MAKRALITGVTGQDGSYLAELLISKGYEVHGIVRRASSPSTARLEMLCRKAEALQGKLRLHYGDMSDSTSLFRVVKEVCPDEVYNLAAQSQVHVSFENPEYTTDVTATGTVRLLEAIRLSGLRPRFYQASSSEMFGLAQESPQRETTPFHPRSPYACAKVHAYWATVNYREAYGFHANNGILFNHESPRRGEAFVTRKITMAVARILAGMQDKLCLGNLEACRDWGYAKEYVEAMWLMLQQETPDDYVIATGETHSVREFLEAAFGYAGLDWQKHVVVDPALCRPAEVGHLVGDASKAEKRLGWKPQTRFNDLVKLMVDADIALLRSEQNRVPSVT